MAYKAPEIDFLTKQIDGSDITDDYIADMQKIIVDVLETYSIKAEIIGYVKSPLNVTFEFSLDNGQRFSELKNLTKEIEVALGTPVKFYQSDDNPSCCLAVPHNEKEIVRLREVISSKEFRSSNSSLLLAGGITERGSSVFLDLKESPHALITGTTGSGKTVFLDDAIISILYNYSPKDVRLVLIDPTYTDFGVYADLPHLLCPVLKNKGEVNEAMRLISEEISNRNKLFAEEGVKDQKAYNEKHFMKKISSIVIMIDKYIELSKEMPDGFEEYISKIAAMGRSVGIHIIINTQSSSSDVLSGTIKNNLKAKIAFSLASGTESRMAIDKTGAEKLTVPGEMILDRGNEYPTVHAQAPYVSFKEIESIVEFVKINNDKVEYASGYDWVRGDYGIKDNIALMLKALKLLSAISRFNISKLQKALSISLPEVYELIDVLEENLFIEPVIGSYHNVNHDAVVTAVEIMEKTV